MYFLLFSVATRNTSYDLDDDSLVEFVKKWVTWAHDRFVELFAECFTLDDHRFNYEDWRYDILVDMLLKRIICVCVKYGSVVQMAELYLGNTSVEDIVREINEEEGGRYRDYSFVHVFGELYKVALDITKDLHDGCIRMSVEIFRTTQ